MNTLYQESVNTRLLMLETQTRKLRFSHFVNFALLIALITMSVIQYIGMDFTRGKVVSAEKFVLKDRQGDIRAEIKSDDNVTNFALFDINGVPRASMAVTDGDPGFHLYDQYGFRQAVMGISPKGPNLVFMKQDGLQHAGITLLDNGNLGYYYGQGKNSMQPIPISLYCIDRIKIHNNIF